MLDSAALSLRYKRELALTMAIALLGLHEETWLRQGCTKETISFFHTSNDKLDFQRPFISTYFEDVAKLGALPTHVSHGNPRILALGILLLEIHKWKPIETFRQNDDLSAGDELNAYTDFLVVDREAEHLDDCSLDYRDAIVACMKTTWVGTDEEVSLEDPRVREGLYKDVITPLKNEISNLFRVVY